MGLPTIQRILSWQLPPSEKHVLTLLAFHRNEKTGRCDPSVAGLMDESGYDRRTIQRALTGLEKREAITRNSRIGTTTFYLISDVFTGVTTPPLPSVTTPPHPRQCDAAGASMRRCGGVNVTPEPKRTRKNTNTTTSSDVVGPVFVLKSGRPWQTTTTAFEKLVEAYPNIDIAATLSQAAAWCDANPGRRKTATGMPRFLNGWLSRSGTRGVPPKPDDGKPLSFKDAMAQFDWLPPMSDESRRALAEVEAKLTRDAP